MKSPALMAAVAHLVFVWIMGFYMTVAFRAGIAVLKREGFEADAEAILQSKAFNVAHRVQLNNAEWAPFYILCLLFLHQNAPASRAVYLAGFGSVLCSVGYVFVKISTLEGDAPINVLGRYGTLAWLIYQVYQAGTSAEKRD
mmetsp:Transcript_16612/g.51723  ORF Transcript_16612/g.51723 Transcript_16612/m.51723 type:complete len:142 (-) Transcript_16612:126-551(-)